MIKLIMINHRWSVKEWDCRKVPFVVGVPGADQTCITNNRVVSCANVLRLLWLLILAERFAGKS